MTARQSRLMALGGLSISSDSSSQSSAESLACSGPNNSVTAQMNADNSRSAMLIWFSQVELRTDSSLSMGNSPYLGCVLCEDKVASFDRLVAGEAGFELRVVVRFSVLELSETPAARRGVFS